MLPTDVSLQYGLSMPDDDKPPEKPVPQWAPDEQALLPGMRPVLGYPPRDWRPWSDGKGNKIDGPRYGGPTFGGKTVVPLVGADGKPISLGTFQIVRNVRGLHSVIDLSKPMFDDRRAGDDVGDEVPHTSAIMGKQVFKPHPDLRRAMAAMVVLARDAEADKARLPHDPAQCLDDNKKEIKRGPVSLCRYARGKTAGRFAVVDNSFEPRRIFDLDAKNLRAALKLFEKHAARRAAAQPRPVVRGAPIAFDVPSGFGGGGAGGGGFRSSWAEKTYPEPGSPSWSTSVALFAQTGKWCRTANMIWGDQRPAELEEEARGAREEFLREAAKREPEKDDKAALRAMKRLSEGEKTLVNILLEHFEAVLVEVSSPSSKR